ncbi:MAG: MFS transporter [Gammaproteobacteria bacterium]|nr:MFS transporter [Gammaproteobacteria bacterium]MDH5303829.1 MFS transporter [Gammaproteobacteria bacterium]MDH5322308.1 MFS transporter [Gammaproteobacteria bacterium]
MTMDEKPATRNYPKTAYAWFVVVLMMCFYVLSYMDRFVIAVLIEPIKADLLLSDVQISLIGSFSFGLFYATVGLFIGRLADSMHRPWLIAMGVFIWSLTTALSGLASKFWHLLVLRMGVGLGESALLPSTLSLLTDYFPPKRLATPTSVFLFGAPIGIGVSYAAGGALFAVAQGITAADGWSEVLFIGGSAAWKLVLIFLGVVGMVMTLGMLAVREPRNNSVAALEKQAERSLKAADAAPLPEVFAYASKNWLPIACLYLGMALISLAAYAQGFWDLTFLSRSFGLDTKTAGFSYGMVQLFGGLCGMFVGGMTADFLSRKGVQGSSYKLVTIGSAFAVPFSLIYPLMGSDVASLSWMVLAIFGSNMCFAGAAAAMQRMFPGTMLGLAAGFYFFMSNAIGLLVGPTAVAAITDYGFGDPGQVGYSLAIVGGSARLSAFVLFLLGLKAYVNLLREREAAAST